MAEWLKAAVLKTANPRGFVGSNPTASSRAAVSLTAKLFVILET